MRESASTDLREPQGSNPLGPPGPELPQTRKAISSLTAKDCRGFLSDLSPDLVTHSDLPSFLKN